MRRILLALGFLLTLVAWADTVYWETGRVWQGIKVVDANQHSSGPVVVIETTTRTTPNTVKPGSYFNAVHIQFGDGPVSPTLGFKSPHRAVVATVKRVIDPATFDLSTGQKIRLLGVLPLKAGEFYEREAVKFSEALVIGRKVWIEFDQERLGKNGEVLGYAFVLPSRTFLNENLIANGCTRADVKSSFRADYVGRFRDAETKAYIEGKGLWDLSAGLKSVQEKRVQPVPPLARKPTPGVNVLSPPAGGPATAETVPIQGYASPGTDSGKTVRVKGYTRDDGTYVRPHTRRPPKR